MKPEVENLKPEIEKAAAGKWTGTGQPSAVWKVTEGYGRVFLKMKPETEDLKPEIEGYRRAQTAATVQLNPSESHLIKANQGLSKPPQRALEQQHTGGYANRSL